MTLKTIETSIYILNIRHRMNIIRRTHVYGSTLKIREKLVTKRSRNCDINQPFINTTRI